MRIAERCNVEFEFGKTKLPYFAAPDGEDNLSYFRRMSYEGMHRLYGENPDPSVTERPVSYTHLGGAGVDVHLVPERVDEMSHSLKVGVGAEMLDLSLLHVQVILQTEPLEFVIGLEPLGGGSVLHHDAVCFLNIADHRFRREKVGEPTAVFGGDDILAVRKEMCIRDRDISIYNDKFLGSAEVEKRTARICELASQLND